MNFYTLLFLALCMVPAKAELSGSTLVEHTIKLPIASPIHALAFCVLGPFLGALPTEEKPFYNYCVFAGLCMANTITLLAVWLLDKKTLPIHTAWGYAVAPVAFLLYALKMFNTPQMNSLAFATNEYRAKILITSAMGASLIGFMIIGTLEILKLAINTGAQPFVL